MVRCDTACRLSFSAASHFCHRVGSGAALKKRDQPICWNHGRVLPPGKERTLMSDPIDAVAPQGHVAGVRGTSVEWHGVLGVTNSAGFNGVTGLADQGGGAGVLGRSHWMGANCCDD